MITYFKCRVVCETTPKTAGKLHLNPWPVPCILLLDRKYTDNTSEIIIMASDSYKRQCV